MPVNEVNRIMAPMDFDDAVRSSPHPTRTIHPKLHQKKENY